MIKNYVFKYKSLITFLAIVLLIIIFCYPAVSHAQDNNNALAAVLKSVTTVVFIAFFTLFAGITLLAIAVMLVIRYVYLTILLILSPIVWLLWIFPSTAGLWKKWWSQFLRWAFFAPVMLFFLYLTISVIDSYPAMFVKYAGEGIVRGDLTNQGFALPVAYIGNLVAILGLLLGGLIAANSLGITFAGTAFGWAQSIGKSFGGWVGRKGIQLGTSPLRGKWGTKAIEALEKFGVTGKTGRGWRALQTITKPIRAQVGERLSKLAVTGGEKAVKEAGEKYKDWDDNRLAKAIYTMDAPEQVAALQRLRQNKTLDLLPDASAFVNQTTQDLFIKYGQPKPDYDNLERTVGYNMDVLRALREGPFEKEVEDEETGEKKKVKITLADAKRAFWKNFRPEHANKLQIDDYFRPRPEFGLKLEEKEAMHSEDVKSILETNPDILANIYRGIKGQNLDHFNKHLFAFMGGQAEAAGKNTIREWLNSVIDPATNRKKYGRLITWLNSPAARSLGVGAELDAPVGRGSAPKFTTA